MRFHTFLLKYGEIGIKGKNRHLFEDALVRQVRYALKDVDGQFDVHKSQARIYVDCEGDYDYDETVEHLKKVFGLVGICPVVRMEDKGFEELKKDVVAYMDEMYPDKNFTFKVESRRAKKSYPLNSMEISRDLGEAILYAFPESGIKVDVHHPDVMVNVEVRNEIYVYSQIIPGAGGMPVGTNGSAMLLLSGGIDSPVAGYMVSKRGVSLEATYFHAPPYTSERAKQKVVDLAKKVAKYSGPIKLHGVETNYHKIWDGQLLDSRHKFWGFQDYRHALDNYTDEEIARMTEGTPVEWFEESARRCREIYDWVQPGDELGQEFYNAHAPVSYTHLTLPTT